MILSRKRATNANSAITLIVEGSAADPYQVDIVNRGSGNLSAYCTCAAGERGQHCKHRTAVLAGDFGRVIDAPDSAAKTLSEWLEGTDVKAALEAVVNAELAVERAKSAFSKAKRHLAQCMLD